MSQINTYASALQSIKLAPIHSEAQAQPEVPTYQTVEVIVPRDLCKQLRKRSNDLLAQKLARLLQEEGPQLPLIAVISVSGPETEMRFQSARTEDLLLVGEKEFANWKVGDGQAFIRVLINALERPAEFVRLDGFAAFKN